MCKCESTQPVNIIDALKNQGSFDQATACVCVETQILCKENENAGSNLAVWFAFAILESKHSQLAVAFRAMET